MLAHELRNPLAPIRNALQIMRLTGGDGRGLRPASEMMERQVEQMVRLVDDLLDVSRISRGKIELRKERVDLASVRRATPSRPPARYRRAGPRADRHAAAGAGLPGRRPDPAGAGRRNLLNNAGKYTEPGRPHSADRRARRRARPSSGSGTPASASPPRSCRPSSSCSPRSTRRWSGRRAGWGSG